MEYFKRIREKYDFGVLFEVGPYNRFKCGKRVELTGEKVSPHTLIDKQNLMEKVSSQVNNLIEKEFHNSEYMVLLKFEELAEEMSYTLESVMLNLGVVEYHVIETASYEDIDNELFSFLFLIDVTNCEFQKIIRAFLARHIDLEPYVMAELFIVSKDLSKYANLYDDRGMDFIELEK
ncbi:DUF3885 domain-containing protein [Pseudoalteromonas aurantia]|nr:hypothetical protein [Pseudoalteromonas aurantia]